MARHVAVSPGGTLAYVPAAQAYTLVLVEPDGSERLLSQAPLLENPQFSPNGQRLVVATTRRVGERRICGYTTSGAQLRPRG